MKPATNKDQQLQRPSPSIGLLVFSPFSPIFPVHLSLSHRLFSLFPLVSSTVALLYYSEASAPHLTRVLFTGDA